MYQSKRAYSKCFKTSFTDPGFPLSPPQSKPIQSRRKNLQKLRACKFVLVCFAITIFLWLHIQKGLCLLVHCMHSVGLGSNVSLHQAVLLKQIFHTKQVLAIVLRKQHELKEVEHKESGIVAVLNRVQIFPFCAWCFSHIIISLNCSTF